MITLIKILFFGSTVLLTPDRVDVSKTCIDIVPDEAISAITPGASLRIDITNLFEGVVNGSIKKVRAHVADVIPVDSVSASLDGEDGEHVELRYFGNTSIGSRNAFIILERESGVPTDIEFHRVKICSEIILNDILVLWKNYSM